MIVHSLIKQACGVRFMEGEPHTVLVRVGVDETSAGTKGGGGQTGELSEQVGGGEEVRHGHDQHIGGLKHKTSRAGREEKLEGRVIIQAAADMLLLATLPSPFEFWSGPSVAVRRRQLSKRRRRRKRHVSTSSTANLHASDVARRMSSPWAMRWPMRLRQRQRQKWTRPEKRRRLQWS
jgi:hypothetical protein